MPPRARLRARSGVAGRGSGGGARGSGEALAKRGSGPAERSEALGPCGSVDRRIVALVTDPKSTRRFLRGVGEKAEPPAREPARGPPYWKSRVLRRAARDDESVA